MKANPITPKKEEENKRSEEREKTRKGRKRGEKNLSSKVVKLIWIAYQKRNFYYNKQQNKAKKQKKKSPFPISTNS